MAGDWIKMRTNLDTDPRVIEISSTLAIPEMQVVGCLWKLWAWADSHSLDGNAIRVTNVTLDSFTRVTGFADALRKVGWLEGRDNALTFPRFDEHNGHTAKQRAETKDRVKNHRAGKSNEKTVTNVTQKPLPEKRREEKKRENKKEALSLNWEDTGEDIQSPKQTQHVLESTQGRINSLNPSWRKRPAFTYQEQADLLANLKVFRGIGEDDWNLLESYMAAEIPESWGKFWQPDSRGRFVQAVSDVLSLADKWKRECEKRKIPWRNAGQASLKS